MHSGHIEFIHMRVLMLIGSSFWFVFLYSYLQNRFGDLLIFEIDNSNWKYKSKFLNNLKIQ